MVTFPAIVI